MTYSAFQADVLSRVRPSTADRLSSRPDVTERVLRGCLEVAGRMGVDRALRNRAAYTTACRRKLGLRTGGWLADLIGSLFRDMAKQLLMDALEALLPALIAWLQAQFDALIQRTTESGWTPLDAVCLRLAEDRA